MRSSITATLVALSLSVTYFCHRRTLLQVVGNDAEGVAALLGQQDWSKGRDDRNAGALVDAQAGIDAPEVTMPDDATPRFSSARRWAAVVAWRGSAWSSRWQFELAFWPPIMMYLSRWRPRSPIWPRLAILPDVGVGPVVAGVPDLHRHVCICSACAKSASAARERRFFHDFSSASAGSVRQSAGCPGLPSQRRQPCNGQPDHILAEVAAGSAPFCKPMEPF